MCQVLVLGAKVRRKRLRLLCVLAYHTVHGLSTSSLPCSLCLHVSNRNFERHTAQLLNNLAGGANATLAVLGQMEGGLRSQTQTQQALHKSLEQVWPGARVRQPATGLRGARALPCLCARSVPAARVPPAYLLASLLIPQPSVPRRSARSSRGCRRAWLRGWGSWARCSRRRRGWGSR